jgi:hypothetical protein
VHGHVHAFPLSLAHAQVYVQDQVGHHFAIETIAATAGFMPGNGLFR